MEGNDRTQSTHSSHLGYMWDHLFRGQYILEGEEVENKMLYNVPLNQKSHFDEK